MCANEVALTEMVFIFFLHRGGLEHFGYANVDFEEWASIQCVIPKDIVRIGEGSPCYGGGWNYTI